MENTKNNPQASGSNIRGFEEKLKQIEEKNKLPLPGKFTHDELMKALYYVWDAYDRACITMFLRGQTAQCATRDVPMSGDKLEIGMRYNERHSGAWRILTNFAEPIKEDGSMIYFLHEGIPIECRVFFDDLYFDSVVPVLYQYEAFNVPNPYADYVAKYETPEVKKPTVGEPKTIV